MRKDKLIAEVLGEELAITPSDLCHHETRRQLLLGYRRKEVDALLERTADVLESIIDQVRALKQENESLRVRLEEQREMESTLRNALVSSQKFSEEIVESARREAAAILSEARARKTEVEQDAARLPERLGREIQTLEEQRDRLRRELGAVLEIHRGMLERMLPSRADGQPNSFVEVDAQSAWNSAVVALEGSRVEESNTAAPDSSNAVSDGVRPGNRDGSFEDEGMQPESAAGHDGDTPPDRAAGENV